VSEDHPRPTDLRWSAFGADPVAVTVMACSVVVELSTDTASELGRGRHPTRFLRCRPDLSQPTWRYARTGPLPPDLSTTRCSY